MHMRSVIFKDHGKLLQIGPEREQIFVFNATVSV